MENVNELLMYWTLGGLGVILGGITIYVLRTAFSVLHEHGKTVEFSFPIFRSMTQNSKTVTIVILIIVISGLIWAVNYGG